MTLTPSQIENTENTERDSERLREHTEREKAQSTQRNATQRRENFHNQIITTFFKASSFIVHNLRYYKPNVHPAPDPEDKTTQ